MIIIGKLSALLGALALVASGYFLLAPHTHDFADGNTQACGSYWDRKNTNDEGIKVACAADLGRRAGLSVTALAVAAVVGVGGPLLFRAPRPEQATPARTAF